MRITSSRLDLASTHELVRKDVRTEHLEVWKGQRPGTAAAVGGPVAPAEAPPAKGCGDDEKHVDLKTMQYLVLIKTIARLGHKGGAEEASLADGLRAVADVIDAHESPAPLDLPQLPARGQSAPALAPPVGWGLIYDLHEEHQERERTTFSALGRVTTADGRTVNVAASLEMARAHTSTKDVHLRLGDATKIDPLVLNLAGGAATFSGRQTFDLDADGKRESIARLAGGSVYLALDRNGNGTIDDGRELFGPRTGDGFGELVQHDGDHNGWIDEADSVWRELRVWQPGEGDACGKLSTLAEANVGAIALARTATPFTIAPDGRAQASVGETGVYLHESGEVGTIQHVDIVV